MDDYFQVNDPTILQSRDSQDTILERLASYMIESQLKFKSSLEEYQNKRRDAVHRRKKNVEIINQLQNKSKNIEQEIDEVVLQQKIIYKKILNCTEMINDLSIKIDKGKSTKERLAVAMVDLERNLEIKNAEKRNEWNAVKKAKAIFKDKLNIHIDYTEMDDHDCITVTYFLYENPDKDNYYVQLLYYYDKNWKVLSIEPTLDDDHLKQLNLDFTQVYDIGAIMLYLVKIRKIFLKHYFKR